MILDGEKKLEPMDSISKPDQDEKMNPNKYLVIDVEATCSENNTVPRDKMEIIEIGAVIVDRESLEISDEFSTFVRPVRNPFLTEFCKKLTTITQEQVDNAPLFPEALRLLCDRLWSDTGTLFCSWGNYDKNQFQQDCTHHNLAYPFGDHHLNLKTEFAAVQKKRRCGVQRALKHVDLGFEGTPHRGIDDARNIARLLRYIVR